MFFKRAKKSDEASPAVAAVAAAPVAVEKPSSHLPLDADKLRRLTNAAKLGFKTTADVARSSAEPFDARSVWEALRSAFPASAAKSNAHVLITTPAGTGGVRAVASHLASLPQAIDAAAPDWLYVPAEGRLGEWTAIPVPAGQGKRLAAGITAVVAQLRNTLPYLLQGEDLTLRRTAIESGFAAVRDDAFGRLRAMAHAQNVAVLTTPMGFAVAPMHEGKVVKPEVLARLPQAMRDEVRRKVESVEAELQTLLADVPSEAGGQVGELAELIADYVRPAVTSGFEGLAKEFSGASEVMAHLSFAQDDIVRRACRDGAAVTLPDYGGRVIEGAGKTLVEIQLPINAAAIAEALLRAGKGAVLIDAAYLDGSPAAWTMLLSAIQSRRVELPNAAAQPLPITSSVVLVGEPKSIAQLTGYTLASVFTAQQAFAADAPRNEDTEGALAKMIAVAADDRGLLPLDAAAVAHLIGEAARAAGRPDRLSADLTAPLAIAADASRAAALASRSTVSETDIQAALAERRVAIVQPLFAPAASSLAGRVLAVGLAPDPVEVWATVRPGNGAAADIARAAPASADAPGAAAAMLWSLLASRFVPSAQLSLSAAIVHEPPLTAGNAVRTSAAEAYALFSALAETPIAGSFAAAGWVSPSGALLPLAGINAAIESAFDNNGGRDAARPLSIVIPRANEADLMLRADVVEAARKGKLQIFTAADIDEGLAILTGVKAGTRTDSEPTLNRLIEDRLVGFARQATVNMIAAQQPARTGTKSAAP
ncbi:MAG: AAA family ATPase [Hyphomicrobiaceae bacterium]|nr:AAA family ATPase [Hyphomicrobiaceae bacterium]